MKTGTSAFLRAAILIAPIITAALLFPPQSSVFAATTLTVTPTAYGPLANAATVDPSNGMLEIEEDNNMGAHTLTVLAAPSISKSFSPNPIAAGGTSTLTFTISNPDTVTALTGVAFTDPLPAGVALAANVVTPQCGGTLTGTSGGSQIALTGGSVAAGGSCTITASVTASSAGSYVNTTGNVTSTNGGIGNTATATLAVLEAAPVKSLVTTSEPSTTLVGSTQRVTIGEMIRYRIATFLPQGTFNGVQLIDALPTGLQFMDDGTVKVAFVCNGGANCITSSSLSGAGLVINGASNNVTPTFTLDTSAILGGPFGSGTDVTFSLGNLTNTDSDADSEFVVVEFNAMVMNVNSTATINQGVNNQTGASNTNFRSNHVSLSISGRTVGAASPNVTVSVAEPSMSVITKSLSPGPYLPGGTITYTMTFSNNATGNNATTAFDVVVIDTLNANLTPGAVNVSSTQGVTCAGGTLFSTTNITTGQAVAVNISCLDPGSSVTITIGATINLSVPLGAAIANSASLTYTSLPGVRGTCASAPFSCDALETSGSDSGERDGSNGPGADATVLNNYAVISNTASFTVVTATPTHTQTTTATNTSTSTPTYTPTVTATDVPTSTPTFTATATVSPTVTGTSTATTTPTNTPTASPTASPTVTPHLFDPPLGIKTFDDSGLPILKWTMVWINNSNTVAMNSLVSDAVPVGTAYLASGSSSGFPVPVSAPAGSTNLGVSCTETSPVTVTSLCYYEGPTGAFPRGRIVWVGTLGPDPGATGASNANNEITVTFTLDVDDDTTSVRNRATIDADLNSDGDATDPGEQRVSSASATWRRSMSRRLPPTGFAPNKVTDLRHIPRETYFQTGGIALEIPSLKLNLPIVGVPLRNGDWNVAWLGNQAGWLEGSAFPSWNGNSVITSHVYLSSGLPGPFVNLNALRYGEEVIVHAYGQKYTFEVRTNEIVEPNDISAFQHEERPWLTLVTCREHDEKTNTYRKRVLVRAVLVSVSDR